MLIVVLVTQLYIFVKTRITIIHLLENSTICKLYLDKPDFKILTMKTKKVKKYYIRIKLREEK